MAMNLIIFLIVIYLTCVVILTVIYIGCLVIIFCQLHPRRARWMVRK